MNIRELDMKPRTRSAIASGASMSSLTNLNLDFAVQFQTRGHNPVECLHELEHQVMREHQSGHQIEMMASMDGTVPGGHVDQPAADIFDTFDNYIQRIEEMETVMAFYYRGEDNTMNVTEIRASKPGLESSLSRRSSLCAPISDSTEAATQPYSVSELSDLSWDNYQPMRDESLSLEDFERADIAL